MSLRKTSWARLFGSTPARFRFAWHRSYVGCEVSPHTDSSDKLGTFVFFFNSAQDWHYSYGGATLLLGGLPAGKTCPDFSDFETEIQAHPLDFQCLVFKKTETSWHGVKPLICPEGYHRKTFHVIAEA